MTEEESYTLFVQGLKLEIKTSMGVNVLEGLEDAILGTVCRLVAVQGGSWTRGKSWKKKTKRESEYCFWGAWPICLWPSGDCTRSCATELWWPVRERRGQGKTKRQAAAKATPGPKATRMFYLW